MMIPTPYKLGALAVVIAAALGYHAYGVHVARNEGRAEVQAKWDQERAKQATDLLTHNAAVRAEEQRRQLAQDQIEHDYQTQVAKHAADAASAVSAYQRLLNNLKASTPAAKRLPGDPIPTFVCTAEPETRELLRSCAGRYVEMGRLADAAYDAGKACERWADALKK